MNATKKEKISQNVRFVLAMITIATNAGWLRAAASMTDIDAAQGGRSILAGLCQHLPEEYVDNMRSNHQAVENILADQIRLIRQAV